MKKVLSSVPAGGWQSSIPGRFLCQTFGTCKYRELQNNWGGKRLWSGLDEVAQSHVQLRFEWFQAWRSYCLSGLPCPCLTTPFEKKWFPSISSYFPLAAVIILFFTAWDSGDVGSSANMVKDSAVPHMGRVFWLSLLISKSGKIRVVCDAWNTPEKSSLEHHLPTHKCMVHDEWRSHFFTQSQAGFSLLRAQGPPVNQLTKNEVAGACFWQYKRKQPAK